MRIKFTYLALLIALSLSGNISAQEVPELSGPFGNLVVPEVELFEIPYPEGLGGRPNVLFKLTPSATYADGSDIYGATFAGDFGFGNSNQVSIDARYLNIDTGNSGDFDQWRWRGKYKLPLDSINYNASLVAEYTTLENIYDQSKASISVSRDLTASSKFILNAGWVKRDFDGAGNVKDFSAAIGYQKAFSPDIAISIDHAFKNDVTDDSFSITAIIKRAWAIGVANDDTYYATYTLSF